MGRTAGALVLLIVSLHGSPAFGDIQEPQADLSVQVAGPPVTVSVPEETRLSAMVTNYGPADAPSVQVEVELPDGLVPMAIHQGPWGCILDPAVACFLAGLAAGSSAVVEVTVAVVRPGSQTVAGSLIQASPDPDPSNDVATTLVPASGQPCDALGTRGPDMLRAKGRSRVACGLRGDDVIHGGDGRQSLFGGPGHDALGGGPGGDRLDGGAGRDACDGPGTGCEVRSFARAGSLPLYPVARRTVGYGYHQSLFGTALAMRPVAPHRVMASRGRGTGATTAVDIVVPARGGIRSPVSGRVVAVERYLLYCRTRDWKVVLAPRSHPRLRVLVLHMARPTVREGDDALAGSTLLGRAARNDQPSAQANRYFSDRYPHVHVEVERNRASPTPGCSLRR